MPGAVEVFAGHRWAKLLAQRIASPRIAGASARPGLAAHPPRTGWFGGDTPGMARPENGGVVAASFPRHPGISTLLTGFGLRAAGPRRLDGKPRLENDYGGMRAAAGFRDAYRE